MKTYNVTLSGAFLKVNADDEDEAYTRAEQILGNILFDFDIESVEVE